MNVLRRNDVAANRRQTPDDKAGWRRVRFGDIVECVNETVADPQAAGIDRVVGLDHLDPGSLHIKRWADIQDGTTFTRRFRAGQVLFGKRRAYQRKLAVAEFDGICSGDILVFEPKDDNVIPELLPFTMQAEGFWQHALDTSAGSLSPRTKWQDLARYELMLPPKHDQRRIAEILWTADDNLTTAARVVERGQELKSVAFEELVRNTAEKHRTDLGDLLLSSPEGGFSVVAAPRDTGHYVLTLTAISCRGYIRNEVKPVYPTEPVLAARLRCGDLLISRSNTIELVGFAGVFDENRSDISFPDTMMRLPVNEAKVEKVFLQEFLLSADGRRQIQRIAAGTSGSMKKINRHNLCKVTIELPDKREQQRILQTLEACSESISQAERHGSQVAALAASLRRYLLERSDHV